MIGNPRTFTGSDYSYMKRTLWQQGFPSDMRSFKADRFAVNKDGGIIFLVRKYDIGGNTASLKPANYMLFLSELRLGRVGKLIVDNSDRRSGCYLDVNRLWRIEGIQFDSGGLVKIILRPFQNKVSQSPKKDLSPPRCDAI